MHTSRVITIFAATCVIHSLAFAIQWMPAETNSYVVAKVFTFSAEDKVYRYDIHVTYNSRGTRMEQIEISGPDGPVSIAKELYADIEFPIPGRFSVAYIGSSTELWISYCGTKIVDGCPTTDWILAVFPLGGKEILKRYFLDLNIELGDINVDTPAPPLTNPIYKQ